MLKKIVLVASLVLATTAAHAWGDREQGALAGAVIGFMIGQNQNQQPQYGGQYPQQQPQYGGQRYYPQTAPRAIYQPTCPPGYMISYERALTGPDVGGRYTDTVVPVCR